MINDKVLNSLQFDKILGKVSDFAVLACSKEEILSSNPSCELKKVDFLLNFTQEAYNLIYDFGFSGVDYFEEILDELELAKKGACLSMAQILKVNCVLKSSRLVKTYINSISEDFPIFKDIVLNLYYDSYLEKEITSKILSEVQMADTASDLLYSLRRNIKLLNDQIKEKLQFYIKSKSSFLQDSLITIRGDRYVIPVKSEHKNKIKGLVHDQSGSGSTFFIEPIEVLELNNQLKTVMLEEEQEIERILLDLSNKIALIADKLYENTNILTQIDVACAKANYAFKTKAIKPLINDIGNINIKRGKHPLIDEKKVVPIDVSVGLKYKFLLISGPNTGGKTVTLKLVGLFSLMAMTGIFIMADQSSCVSVFDNVFTDIGDEQSIEENLSTFSSHLKNLIEICANCNEKSLILLDELGGGTNPDEGIAIAKAVFDRLIERGSCGVLTTHYTALKEYAYDTKAIVNASMEFDSVTLKPLYKVVVGFPGSSNALAIAENLGFDKILLEKARGYLSDSARNYEKILNSAEEERRNAQKILVQHLQNEEKSRETLEYLTKEKENFLKEKEKFLLASKAEGRRIVNEKLEEANELLNQIKEILSKTEINTGDLIKARTLKNQLENKAFYKDEDVNLHVESISNVKEGDLVFVKELGANAIIQKVLKNKNKVIVKGGLATLTVSISSLSLPVKEKKEKEIVVSKPNLSVGASSFIPEINLIGQTVDEALYNLMYFIDKALLNNATEVRIIHGVGLKKLSTAIHNYLKTLSSVDSFRFGKYGEGENGVTIVTFR